MFMVHFMLRAKTDKAPQTFVFTAVLLTTSNIAFDRGDTSHAMRDFSPYS